MRRFHVHGFSTQRTCLVHIPNMTGRSGSKSSPQKRILSDDIACPPTPLEKHSARRYAFRPNTESIPKTASPAHLKASNHSLQTLATRGKEYILPTITPTSTSSRFSGPRCSPCSRPYAFGVVGAHPATITSPPPRPSRQQGCVRRSRPRVAPGTPPCPITPAQRPPRLQR